MMAPTGPAAAWFAVGAVLSLAPALGVAGGWILGALWIGAWVIVVAADALLAPSLAPSPIGLAAPDTLAVGSRIELPLGADPAPAARRVQWHLELDGVLEAEIPSGELPGARLDSVSIALRARQRGGSRLRAVHLRWTGPLGLAWRFRIDRMEQRIKVLPDLGLVQTAVLAAPLGASGAQRSRLVGDGSEFEALREFQVGHDPRAMDWKATARHRRLMVREFRAERDQQVVLAIDTGHLMREPRAAFDPTTPVAEGEGKGDDPMAMSGLDHAIHAALAVARAALMQGDRVGLLAFDAKPRAFLPASRDPGTISRITSACAELDYTQEETNFTLGVTELTRRFRRRSFVLVMTDFVDTITAELMVDNLTRMAQRHLVVFATFRDATRARFVAAPPERIEDVHRALVADRLHRERQEVLQRLRNRGVRCIEVSAGQLVGAAVQRYISLMQQEKV